MVHKMGWPNDIPPAPNNYNTPHPPPDMPAAAPTAAGAVCPPRRRPSPGPPPPPAAPPPWPPRCGAAWPGGPSFTILYGRQATLWWSIRSGLCQQHSTVRRPPSLLCPPPPSFRPLLLKRRLALFVCWGVGCGCGMGQCRVPCMHRVCLQESATRRLDRSIGQRGAERFGCHRAGSPSPTKSIACLLLHIVPVH